MSPGIKAVFGVCLLLQFLLDCHSSIVIVKNVKLRSPYMIQQSLAAQIGSAHIQSFQLLVVSCALGLIIICTYRTVIFIEATGEPSAEKSTFSLPYYLNYKTGGKLTREWIIFIVAMIFVNLLCIDYGFYGIEQKQPYIQSKLVENINDFSDIIIHSHPIHFYQYGDYHREQAGLYLQLLSEQYRRKMINLGN